MADNYIEKQREQYEARKAAWEKAKKLGKNKSKTISSSSKASSSKASLQKPVNEKE